jgi:3D (Asp-Asp-Asp) domain-containing protein
MLLLLPCLLSGAALAQDQGFGQPMGTFRLTYYWIVFEADFPGRPEVPLFDVKGKALAVVPAEFARRISMEGTGVLRDGRVINLHEKCRFAKHGWCFLEVDRRKAPFGYGSTAPLHPFRTVAALADVIPRGTVVYIPEYDGMPLPGSEGGFTFHDGCFVVEDTGWSLEGKHLDVFALSEEYYRTLHKQVGQQEKVHVYTESELCPGSAAALYDPSNWARELLGP